jgi:hypothetical protein
MDVSIVRSPLVWRRFQIRSDGCLGAADGRFHKASPCGLHCDTGLVPCAAPYALSRGQTFPPMDVSIVRSPLVRRRGQIRVGSLFPQWMSALLLGVPLCGGASKFVLLSVGYGIDDRACFFKLQRSRTELQYKHCLYGRTHSDFYRT